MSTTATILSPGEVDSIVLGAADNEIVRLGLTMSAPARVRLLQKSLPVLNQLNKQGELEGAREEIENNTRALIQFVFEEELRSQRGVQITAQHLNSIFSKFCERFPDFRPFCP